ncbi:MAG: nucleoside deaminase [Bacteroidetes bacterium]|nr:MAG: nucleoside deaminase [Bacteroidota bacterium]
MAIEEARKAIRGAEGGPFGAVIVRDGEVIGSGHNTVLASHDPTAHAEINAIRDACTRLGEHHLTGAVLYSNFEPCPMCLSAIYWADIRSVWYCEGHGLAGKLGFSDSRLYQEFGRDPLDREVVSRRMPMEEMRGLVEEWNGMDDRILY